MKNNANIKIYSSILQEAHDSITPQERASFDLNYSISERIYQLLKEKGMTKRNVVRITVSKGDMVKTLSLKKYFAKVPAEEIEKALKYMADSRRETQKCHDGLH